MRWLLWQVEQAGSPSGSQARRCGLWSKSCSWKTWQVPQTRSTEATPGGAAPWLPWQVAQVGDDRSPPVSFW